MLFLETDKQNIVSKTILSAPLPSKSFLVIVFVVKKCYVCVDLMYPGGYV